MTQHESQLAGVDNRIHRYRLLSGHLLFQAVAARAILFGVKSQVKSNEFNIPDAADELDSFPAKPTIIPFSGRGVVSAAAALNYN